MNLSERQLETLRNMSEGMTVKRVARLHGTSPGTVKSCLRIVRLKMGAASTAQAVAMAVRSGLL